VASIKPKKISAKAIMEDLKNGMSDSDLIQKYDISFQALQDIFNKLVDAKLATRAYFDKRSLKQIGGRKPESKRTCPYCGFASQDDIKECPRCKHDVSEWLDTTELTKILTGSFE
jgi:hypothetical protein